MSEITISVGTELHVSASVPETYDEDGYDALTFTEVAEVGSISAFGGSAQVPEWTNIKDGIVQKRKGSINYGDITVPLAAILSDAGQQLIQSGFDGVNRRQVHSVMITNEDIGTIYFTAVISGAQLNLGDANSITQRDVTFALTSRPVIIEPE